MAFEGLDWRLIPIPLQRGVDQKHDPRATPASHLSVLENGEFEKHGGIQKRGGYASMGVATTAAGTVPTTRSRALAVRGDELLWFAGGRTYAWIAKESAWADRGRFESVLVDQETVAHDRENHYRADRAEAGNVIGYIWDTNTAGAPTLRYLFKDKVTKSVMDSAALTEVASGRRGRVIAVDGKLLVFYRSGINIVCDVVDPADVYNTAGAGLTNIATDCYNNSGSAFDVCLCGTSVVLAYVNNASTVTVKKISSAGVVMSTNATGRNARDAGGLGGVVAVSYHATSDRILLVRKDRTAAPADEIRADWLKGADAGDDSTVNILVQTETANTVRNVACASLASQTGSVFWDIAGSSTPWFDQVRKRAVTSSATSGNVQVLARRSYLASGAKMWTDGSTERVLLHVGHGDQNQQQPCHVLLDTATVVGETNGSVGSTDEIGLLARLSPGEGTNFTNGTDLGHLPQIEQVSASVYACAMPFARFLSATGTKYLYAEVGTRDYVFTFNDSRAYRGVEEGRSLYLPGGYKAEYDGKRVYESGFWLYPELAAAPATSTLGGSMAAAKYFYRLYWEWRNAAGEIERSTFSGNVEVDMSASGTATNKVTFTVPTLPYTVKKNVYLAVYRKGTDGLYYRASSTDPSSTGDNALVLNSTNADSITFTDVMADADLMVKAQDPLAEGALDPVCPPCTKIVAAGQARVFTLDPENRSLVRFSMTREDGDAVMSNDSLTLRVPQFGGEVVDIQAGDNAIVIWKEKAVYVAAGQGPDNLGQGLYQAPQKVADVGCVDPRSVIRCPLGWVYKSLKGFRLLDNAYQDHPIGLPVEEDGATDIYGAVHIAAQHQVRFLTATKQLVFDYLIREWSVIPATPSASVSVGGSSMADWQDQPIHLSTSAPIQLQATFVDGDRGYSLVTELPWLTPAELGGFLSAKRLIATLEYRSACLVRIQVAYDFAEDDSAGVGWSQDETFTPSRNGVAVTQPGQTAQVELHLSQRKFQAVKIRISDVFDVAFSTTNLREGMALTGITLEVGTERGPARFPGSQRK